MIDAVTANNVNPAGPVLGILRAYLTDGNPPGGGPSWRTGMSLMDCIDIEESLMTFRHRQTAQCRQCVREKGCSMEIRYAIHACGPSLPSNQSGLLVHDWNNSYQA